MFVEAKINYMESIWIMTLINFVTQVAFIWTRTLNVRAVSDGNIPSALLSGGFVHITWLISVSLSTYSVASLIKYWDWSYLPVPIASLTGGLIGTYIGMIKR